MSLKFMAKLDLPMVFVTWNTKAPPGLPELAALRTPRARSAFAFCALDELPAAAGALQDAKFSKLTALEFQATGVELKMPAVPKFAGLASDRTDQPAGSPEPRPLKFCTYGDVPRATCAELCWAGKMPIKPKIRLDRPTAGRQKFFVDVVFILC